MQPTFTTRPDIRGTFGAVATTHWLATQTGMAVLERGGNAFDAAAAACCGIVEPHRGPGENCRSFSRGRRCARGTRTGRFPPAPSNGSPRWVWRRCPAPGCCPLPCRARSMAGCCCCATTARSRCATCFPRNLLWSGAFRWSAHRQHHHSGGRDQTEWPSSAESGWPTPAPHPASRSARPPSPNLQAHPRRSRGAGGDRARIEAAPAPSTKFRRRGDRPLLPHELMDPTGERHRGLLSGDDLGATRRASSGWSIITGSRCISSGWSQGRDAADAAAAGGASTSPRWTHLGRVGAHACRGVETRFADREAFYGDPDASTCRSRPVVGGYADRAAG